MNTTLNVNEYIQNIPRGKPFVSTSLLQYGERAAVDQALSRLARSGKITRLTRGVYIRPEENRFIGAVLPEPFKIAQAIARKTNEIVQVSGAEAARQFGLTTQVPAQPVFLTTGTSRRFNIGSLEVNLKHICRKKLPFPESKIGLAILALWHIGRSQVTFDTIKKIKDKLTVQEYEQLVQLKEHMPVWMSHILSKYEKGQSNV